MLYEKSWRIGWESDLKLPNSPHLISAHNVFTQSWMYQFKKIKVTFKYDNIVFQQFMFLQGDDTDWLQEALVYSNSLNNICLKRVVLEVPGRG